MKNYHRNNLSILTHSCWILWRGKIWTANFPIFTAWLYTKSSSWALNTGWKGAAPRWLNTCSIQLCSSKLLRKFCWFKFLPADFMLDDTEFVQVRSFASWHFSPLLQFPVSPLLRLLHQDVPNSPSLQTWRLCFHCVFGATTSHLYSMSLCLSIW